MFVGKKIFLPLPNWIIIKYPTRTFKIFGITLGNKIERKKKSIKKRERVEDGLTTIFCITIAQTNLELLLLGLSSHAALEFRSFVAEENRTFHFIITS